MHPTGVADELSGYLLVVATFFALDYTFRTGGHIRIEVLRRFMPPRVRDWMEVLLAFIALGYVSLLLWQTGSLVTASS
ncbi:unnamed protein product, partial [marine sediment metagenome]